ncbi:MotA/TolQ/ExbB proton channel family protein [Flaviramulus basaltis]|uniref:MotA/TolQ/ExbB proton channel family protein n=1 Tax=Flaviramulus basaltis TaxID=369401 RepID=A0A1K2IQQ2_9FLAO|nr:MotA/TolQ/ExbB proton channel family protein [Flaviramulus basaltis]SFZ94536.1 MotA/TolQ/ExbB proton channel family protein [Flaviramulus basaltis]
MNSMLFSLFSKQLLISNPFVDRFNEGGPLFMSLILICLLLSLFFIIMGFINMKKNEQLSKKYIRLTTDSSLLGLVLGFLGSVIGLITAFDSVEAMGSPSPEIFAGGLKVSLLTATFGLFSFIIARLGILILRWLNKADEVTE